MTSTAELERLIGVPPGDPSLILIKNNDDAMRKWISGGRKPILIQWLNAQGVTTERDFRDLTMFRAYAFPNYLRKMLTRGDYNSNVSRSKPASSAPARPKCPQCGADHDDYTRSLCSRCNAAAARPKQVYCKDCGITHGMGECQQPEPLPLTPAMVVSTQQEPKPMPVPNGHAPDTFDALQMLSKGIQAIAGQAINENRVIELIQEHAPVRETVRERIIIQAPETTRELPEAARHRLFPDVLTCVLANIPIMLVGPAGAGKTTLAKQIAAAIERPFAHIGAVMSRFELSGYNDAHGNYQGTAFFRAYTEGHVFLFDEIDGSDPAALLWCNTAIANGVCAFPHGEFERHPEFRLIAGGNTFGRGADRVYVGRNPLDGATLDRFVVMDFDYDEDMERTLFGNTDWTKRVQNVRAVVFQLKLRHVVSPRATDYGRRLLATGMAQDRVEAITLWKGLDTGQIAKVERAIIDGSF